jgi:hypothetical protein
MPEVSSLGSFRIGVDCSQGLATMVVFGEPCGQHIVGECTEACRDTF